MPFNINDFLKFIKQSKNIKEVYISEDKPIFFGVLGNLDKPISLNGDMVNGGLINVQFEKYSNVSREDCMAILHALSMGETINLQPQEEFYLNRSNDWYRITALNQPLYSGVSITYREYHSVNKEDLPFYTETA